MFGVFRLLLATFVLLGHLPAAPVESAANYSVFAFYLLSGYLMTLVLNETYGFSKAGIGRFLVNRALRIYPPYLAAMVLAVVCYVLRWWVRGSAISPLADPGLADWVSQILLLDVPGARVARWIVPSWSLNVEVGFYVALVFLARGRRIALVWVALSLVYVAWTLAAGHTFLERYFTYAAASLPFSLGSLLYHVRESLPRPSLRWGVVTCAAFSVNALAGSRVLHPLLGGFYLSLVLALVVVALLRDARALGVPPRTLRFDARCGDLAYPLFLCHQPIILAVVALLPLRLPSRNAWVAVIGIVLSFLFSWLLHRFVERPVSRWRDRVRPGTGAASDSRSDTATDATPREPLVSSVSAAQSR